MESKTINLPGYEGLYLIYEDGNVFSMRKNRLLKQHINNRIYQYRHVFLVPHNGKGHWHYTHVMVATHFIGKKPEGCEVNHKDLDRSNNHYKNLEWITHAKNMQHARQNSNWLSGRKPGFTVPDSVKEKMAAKKRKKVLLIKDNERIIYDSIEEFCTTQNTYRRLYNNYVNSCKKFKGYLIRTLD